MRHRMLILTVARAGLLVPLTAETHGARVRGATRPPFCAEIRAAGVPAIFAENVANPDLMESIATEAGVKLAPTLYTDALGPPGSPGETYNGMMRSNVTTIVDALKS